MSSSVFLETPKDLFFTKNDPEDQRFGDFMSESSANIFLLGYPDDEGIRMNAGREGAALAPDQIRKYFYKMTPNPFVAKHPLFKDLGNLNPQLSLQVKHEQSQAKCQEVLAQNKLLITLGGGHDYGYPDAAAFLNANPQGVVINFDAHLDVRPTNQGHHSGTPFRRLLEKFPRTPFFEVGILPFCNSPHHFEWAIKQGTTVCTPNELIKNLGKFQGRPLWISLDMDVFSSAIAPGCSQSWATGMQYPEFDSCLEKICQLLDCKGLGIYEVSPPYDHDGMTSKLAASIMHRWIYLNMKDSHR